MKPANILFGLGVGGGKGSPPDVYLFYNCGKEAEFSIEKSSDGFAFTPVSGVPKLIDQGGETVSSKTCRDMKVSGIDRLFVMLYRREGEGGYRTYQATSKDLIIWTTVGAVSIRTSQNHSIGLTQPGMVVPNYKYRGKRVMFYGSGSLSVAIEEKGTTWAPLSEFILAPRVNEFDNGSLEVATVSETDKGLALLYYVSSGCHGADCYAIGAALFDKKNPGKLIWRSETPILEHVEGFDGKEVRPIGVVVRGDTLISYWDVTGEGIVAISHPMTKATKQKDKTLRLVLEKLRENPILKPIAHHMWENKAVFNPAAIYEQGKIHLIYRAVGDSDVSVLGYATSTDGTTIDERLDEPIYVPRTDFEGLHKAAGAGYTSPFFSGGAYGGCEDPRITRVGDRYYMMYVAYNGATPPRVAMSSISVKDFHERNWNWTYPVIISKPGVVDKNACVLSEKVRGKYVVFHRIFPHILVDYVDDLEAFDGTSTFLAGEYKIPPRYHMWDSRKLGIGAPPIKTDEGWLLIYQAVDDREASKYKMGAMLLDLENPHKVMYRSRKPILEPDQQYENEGLKYGVAYPCGAVVHDDMLRVYYGGADMVVCTAHAPVKDFIADLKQHEVATLEPVPVRLGR